MLTGRVPFPQETDTGLKCMKGHTELSPKPVQSLRPDCPGWLAGVVDKALAKDPTHRLKSGGEVRAALEGRQAPTSAPRQTEADRREAVRQASARKNAVGSREDSDWGDEQGVAGKWKGRDTSLRWLWLGLAVLAVVVVGAWWVGSGEENSKDKEEPEKYNRMAERKKQEEKTEEKAQRAFGTLSVTTRPAGAVVSLDGKEYGTTPFRGDVPAGSHRMTLEIEGAQPIKGPVRIERDGTMEVERSFMGTVWVKSPEEATVYLDGEEAGAGEVKDKVLAGRHTVRCTADHHEPEKHEFTITPGETNTIECNPRCVALCDGKECGSDGCGGSCGSCSGGKHCRHGKCSATPYWRDPKTGLTWQNPPSRDETNWDGAESYCRNLSLGGYSDWRLPTIEELRSVIRRCSRTEKGGACVLWERCRGFPRADCKHDNGRCGGCSGGSSRCHWPLEFMGGCTWYWSRTSAMVRGASAWGVNFRNGGIYSDGDGPDSGSVRCLR